MPLVYNSHYFSRSTTAVATRSATFVDDTEAEQTFTTTEDLVMLVIYNVSNSHGQTENVDGKAITIEIDGTDQDGIGVRQDQAPDVQDRKNGCTVYYVGTLSAGAHTVKGRFLCIAGLFRDNTINERQLAIFLFSGTSADFGFDSSDTLSQTTSGTFVDDPEASVTVTTSEDNAVILVLYAAGSVQGDTDHFKGKIIAVNVDDGSDIGHHGQSGDDTGPLTGDTCGCSTHVIYSTLAAGSHTFKGRFKSGFDTAQCSINNRQLAVLVFPSYQVFDQVLDDDTQRNTASTSLVNDADAVVTRTCLTTYQTLILYSSYNNYDSQEDNLGKEAGIMVDDVDYSLSYQSQATSYAVGNTVCHVIELDNGAHTIRGRFAMNNAVGVGVTIDKRTLCVLYFQEKPTQQNLRSLMHGGL